MASRVGACDLPLYSSLDHSRAEIRLLTILPASPTCPNLRCTLRTVSLDDQPSFRALSYTWGDATITEPIAIDGRTISVTVNLKKALRRLRHTREPFEIWADAVCINQNDDNEKGSQIPLMGRLYSEASLVIVWLGDENPDIEIAISWIKMHKSAKSGYLDVVEMDHEENASGSNVLTASHWRYLKDKSNSSIDTAREYLIAVQRAYTGFEELGRLPYWHRMWTYQEFRLPQADPICLFGTLACNATDLLEDLPSDNLNSASGDAIFELTQLFPELDSLSIFGAPSTDSDDDPSNLSSDSFSSAYLLREPLALHTLWLLLAQETPGRQCFNPRDKIYALYGLLPQVQEAIPPDITNTVQEVYRDATEYMVMTEQYYHLWRDFSLWSNGLSDPSRCSWIPEYWQGHSDRTYRHHSVATVCKSLKLSDNTKRPSILPSEPSIFRIWARNLGPCTVVLRFASRALEVLRQISQILSLGDDTILQHPVWSTVRNLGTFRHRFSALCITHYHCRDYTPAEFLVAYTDALRQLESGVQHSGDSLIVDVVIKGVQMLKRKTLFVLSDGTLGIGTYQIEDGDIAVVPFYLSDPIILRDARISNSRTSSDCHAHYKMVCVGIIDGIYETFCSDPGVVEEILTRSPELYLIH